MSQNKNEANEANCNHLLEAYQHLKLGDRQTVFVSILLADIYGREKNVEAQKQYIIAAAISDIRNSVKEYLAYSNRL